MIICDSCLYFRLHSPTVIHQGLACLEFDLYLYGSNMDYLKVYSFSQGDETPIFANNGGQDDIWEHIQIQISINKLDNVRLITIIGLVTLFNPQGNYYVYFHYLQFTWVGSILRGSRGSVALDNIVISAGLCQGKKHSFYWWFTSINI